MSSFNDLYFVSCALSYGAELDRIDGEEQKNFVFSDTALSKAYVLEDGTPVIVENLALDEAYGYYCKRKLLYPPTFPDGRRRFLELVHAKKF